MDKNYNIHLQYEGFANWREVAKQSYVKRMGIKSLPTSSTSTFNHARGRAYQPCGNGMESWWWDYHKEVLFGFGSHQGIGKSRQGGDFWSNSQTPLESSLELLDIVMSGEVGYPWCCLASFPSTLWPISSLGLLSSDDLVWICKRIWFRLALYKLKYWCWKRMGGHYHYGCCILCKTLDLWRAQQRNEYHVVDIQDTLSHFNIQMANQIAAQRERDSEISKIWARQKQVN